MKTVVIKKLFFAWNMDKEKAFLETKAQEGLKLVRVGFGRYEFIESEPEDIVYQFDFRMIGKKDEEEYLSVFEDWEMVQRFGGWYYFRKQRDGKNDQIFSDVTSVKQLYIRLIGFLLLVAFPLYYQVLFMFPSMTSEGGISTFYMIFRPVVYVLLAIHLYAIIKLLLVFRLLNNDVVD